MFEVFELIIVSMSSIGKSGVCTYTALKIGLPGKRIAKFESVCARFVFLCVCVCVCVSVLRFQSTKHLPDIIRLIEYLTKSAAFGSGTPARFLVLVLLK